MFRCVPRLEGCIYGDCKGIPANIPRKHMQVEQRIPLLLKYSLHNLPVDGDCTCLVARRIYDPDLLLEGLGFYGCGYTGGYLISFMPRRITRVVSWVDYCASMATVLGPMNSAISYSNL